MSFIQTGIKRSHRHVLSLYSLSTYLLVDFSHCRRLLVSTFDYFPARDWLQFLKRFICFLKDGYFAV